MKITYRPNKNFDYENEIDVPIVREGKNGYYIEVEMPPERNKSGIVSIHTIRGYIPKELIIKVE